MFLDQFEKLVLVDFGGVVEGDDDVGEFFVKFGAFCEKFAVAAGEGFVVRFVFKWLEGVGPNDGFGVFEVFLEHRLFHFWAGFDVDN